jgi:rSAM/selenodomain-associated transferase 2
VDARLSLSIIIPCLNEEDGISASLDALVAMRARGVEVIVVDGGSTDRTAERARPGADIVVASACGRALQMNAGARRARGDVLLFLHADSRLPPDADALVASGLASTRRVWGRFDVTIVGRHAFLPVIAVAMNMRSRLTGIATGDQAIFVQREVFERIGGYPAIRLMEDIALTRALKRESPPLCIARKVVTSGRRWEKHGVARTILLMWRLRLAYTFGADPDELAMRYVPHK